jgi:formylglycine-generating enzyme required for sulfatase activity
VDAGGYDEPRHWHGAAAEAWRRGESTADGIRAGQRYWLARFADEPPLLDQLLAQGTIRPADHERWRLRLAMTPDALEAHLRQTYPGERFTAPRSWNDPRYNHPSQPVVGICWYEARAYCAWLSQMSGLPLRLPTEAEWEAAARGAAGRPYAFEGEWDPGLANTHDTHIRATTPVGVFPAGDSPEGLQDLTGNVYEWTSSAFGRDRVAPEHAYPYDPDDGREDPDRPDDVLRVSRGGAWASVQATSHAAFRGPLAPGDRNNQGGMRLACGVDPDGVG